MRLAANVVGMQCSGSSCSNGTLAPCSSMPFRLSSFSDTSPAFLFSCNCLSPLLEHSAYSCQTQGHRRLKELGQEESSGFVCPSSRASGACVSVYACMPVCLCVPVSARMGVYMYVCAHVCMYCMCMGMCTYVLTCVRAHVCVCVCMCPVCLCEEGREPRLPGNLSGPQACLLPGTGHCHCPRNRALGESCWTSWAKERRNEITARFAACYLFLLKINDTIERFHSILLKQYPLQGSQEGGGAPGPEGGGSPGEARRLQEPLLPAELPP